MKTIKTLAELKSLLGTGLYVRWSTSPSKDIKRGYSLRCGQDAEPGLSVNDLNDIYQIVEYAFVGGKPWICTGEVAGRGGDNEICLRNVQHLYNIAPALIEYILLANTWRLRREDYSNRKAWHKAPGQTVCSWATRWGATMPQMQAEAAKMGELIRKYGRS